MRIIAVDDERIALESLMKIIKKAVPYAQIQGFRMGKDALEYAGRIPCDIAFLDIEMRDLKGIDLAAMLKKNNPNINIIFTTGYSEYAADAFSLHASGYVMKPITLEKIEKELAELRYKIKKTDHKKVYIRTFGYFEVFDSQGHPLKFRYKKSKELLAYLVDRKGTLCTMNECMDALWGDGDSGNHVSYIKNLRTDLKNTFEQIDAKDVLVRRRGYMAIMPDKVDCDYYEYLKKNGSDKGLESQEYMKQYSWGRTSAERAEQRQDILEKPKPNQASVEKPE